MSYEHLSAAQLVALEEARTGHLTPERYREIVESLTPEQRRLWEEISPFMLDPDTFIEEVATFGAGGRWSGI